MRILYLIFVLCVGALLWVAFAAARHIRRHEAENTAPPEKELRSDELSEEKEVLVPADKS
jgi:hypothetical protein